LDFNVKILLEKSMPTTNQEVIDAEVTEINEKDSTEFYIKKEEQKQEEFKPDPAKTVFIATPAYDGKVHVQYAMSLIDTYALLLTQGFYPIIRVPTCGSLLVADRNRLLQMFWESGAEYMLCIDSDLGWDPNTVLKLMKDGKEMSGGVYPSRDGKGFTFRPETFEDGRIVICPETKLLKMQYIPAGFMLIRRSAVEKLHNKFPETYYSPKDPRSESESAYCIFDTEVWEGEFWGEDYVFCRRAREAGIDIWVDPLIQFDHAGKKGALIEALTTDKEKAQKWNQG